MLNAELLFVLAVYGLYIYDSALALGAKEVVITVSAGLKCSCSLPSPRWMFGGRSLVVPNPLAPSRILIKASWSPTEFPSSGRHVNHDEKKLRVMMARVKVISYLVMILFVLMLILFPVAFLRHAGDDLLVALLVAIYLVILAMLACFWLIRDKVHVPLSEYLKISFECLACPPFAINLIRKISLHGAVVGAAPLVFIKEHLRTVNLYSYYSSLIDLSDALIAVADESSREYDVLTEFRRSIEAMVDDLNE